MAKLALTKERNKKVSSRNSTLILDHHVLQTDRNARIAARAFELYEQRGRKHGGDLQDWFQAENELGFTAS
jgi:hypothetical protein